MTARSRPTLITCEDAAACLPHVDLDEDVDLRACGADCLGEALDPGRAVDGDGEPASSRGDRRAVPCEASRVLPSVCRRGGFVAVTSYAFLPLLCSDCGAPITPGRASTRGRRNGRTCSATLIFRAHIHECVPDKLAKEVVMLWTIAVVLLVLWALGLVSSYTLGGFIHLLLVLAIIVLVVGLIQGRRVA